MRIKVLGVVALCAVLLTGCSHSASSASEQPIYSANSAAIQEVADSDGKVFNNQQNEFDALKQDAEKLLENGEYKDAVTAATKAYVLIGVPGGEEQFLFKVAERLAEECGLENPKASIDLTVTSPVYNGIQIESDTLHQKSEAELIKICEKLDEEGIDIIVAGGIAGGVDKPYLINDLVDGETRYFVSGGRLIARSNDIANSILPSTSVESSKINQSVSQEYQNALTKGLQYANQLHMSKQGVYDQLTSPYGEGFPADAAQYAIDNMSDVDWNANALAKAQEYYYGLAMSKNELYNQLISDYGERFTASQAQYAIDHLD